MARATGLKRAGPGLSQGWVKARWRPQACPGGRSCCCGCFVGLPQEVDGNALMLASAKSRHGAAALERRREGIKGAGE